MHRPLLLSATVIGTTMLGIGAKVPAQTGAAETLTGSVTLGARGVEVGGAVTKYREDINLDDGVRVFDLAIGYRPGSGAGVVDSVDIAASHLGGDPFESMLVDVRKFGSYRLRLDRRRSESFYADTILPPPIASVPGVTGGDFHTFDFQRIRETARLDITAAPQTSVFVDLERQRREGDSTTTLDLQRDEFELERPIDESSNRLGLGIQHRWDRVNLSYEERAATFDNALETFLPGASPGGNEADPAELQYFFLDQSYDYDSRQRSLNIVANPGDSIDIHALWQSEKFDLDALASELSAGTDFSGNPFMIDAEGPAVVERRSEIAGVDLGLRLGSRARLLASTRRKALDQDGSMQFDADTGMGQWRIDTTGFELGAEYVIRPSLILAGGFSQESRETRFLRSFDGSATADDLKTERDGYFLRLRYAPAARIDLTASVEANDIDDPYTLASPTGSQRTKLTIRYAWDMGLSLSGTARRTDVENDRSLWTADTEQLDIRLSYRIPDLEISAGFSDLQLTREIEQLVTGGSIQVPFSIAYAADSKFADVWARWRLNERTAIGGAGRRYDNRGSYPIDRDEWRAFVEFNVTPTYMLAFNYRTIDYVEDAFDDYDADIAEIAVRLDW